MQSGVGDLPKQDHFERAEELLGEENDFSNLIALL
jgi:hypothetical protein